MTETHSEPGQPVGELYVVATPIGRLDDLSPRAASVLQKVDAVAAEDTRTSRPLLDRVGSRAKTIAAHRHNEREAAQRIVAMLREGLSVALITDAGTPAISDPGARVVSEVLDAGCRVVPVPGPSAPVAMLSACGMCEGAFHFEGFLPAKARARDARLAALAKLAHPFVLFEAPHRIAQTLPAIAAACGERRWVALGRELTKMFEEIHRCRAGEAPAWLAADANRERGEYVLVIAPAGWEPGGVDADRAGEDGAQPDEASAAKVEVELPALLDALLDELSPSRAARLAQRLSGRPHREVYALALERAGQRGQGDGDG